MSVNLDIDIHAPGVRYWINDSPDNSSSENEIFLDSSRSTTPDPLVEIRARLARQRQREAAEHRRQRSISNSSVSSVSSDSSVSSVSSVDSIPYSVTSSEAGPVHVATQCPELTETEENVYRGLGLIGLRDESDGEGNNTNGDDN
ncbi:unnamed protein product [Caenorhabditis brenneri]